VVAVTVPLMATAVRQAVVADGGTGALGRFTNDYPSDLIPIGSRQSRSTRP